MIAHKIELKPNKKQITYFQKACGVSRLAWNWGLCNWEKQYKDGLEPSGIALKKEFNSIKKKQFSFVYEVTKYAVQQPFLQLQEAYKRFFKKIGGKPKFKKKNRSKDSFYIGGDQIKVINKKVKIPNLGLVKLTEDIKFNGKILNATVSRIADKWFISFGIKPSMSYLPCKNQASVGIDLGVKTLLSLSNGTIIQSPKPLNKYLKKLKRLSRQLSKKQHSRKKGDFTPQSNNFKKHSLKLARLHKKIADIRRDSMHKITTFLTDNFKYISIEDLNVKGMMSNSKLSKAISDLGFYEFKRQLKYKSENKSNILLINDKWFPSSKTCSNCGNHKANLTLKDRIYKCSECNLEIDRDLNASINLHNQLPIVHREVKPVEITAMDLKAKLLNLTSIVESGSKYQTNLIISKFE
ncbi:MAG: transposase [Campylobacterota bacterium]|nr:transposase [Campylobacterota bacterium]